MAQSILTPTADTYLDKWNPTTNYEASGLRIGADGSNNELYNSILRFNLSGISPCVVTSATLALTVYSWGGTTVTALSYRLRTGRDWVEDQATWNIYKTSNNWGTAGCANTTTDRYSTVMSTTTITFGANVVTLDPTEVQYMVDEGASNQGIIFVSNVTGNSVLCRDSESGVSIPTLTIIYTPSSHRIRLRTNTKFW